MERTSANGRAMQGSMFWTWHHDDLKAVALPIDDYAIFLGDPVFADMRRHANVMRGGVTPRSLRACGRLGGSGGVGGDGDAQQQQQEEEEEERGGGIFDIFNTGGSAGSGGGLFGRLQSPCLFGALFC